VLPKIIFLLHLKVHGWPWWWTTSAKSTWIWIPLIPIFPKMTFFRLDTHLFPAGLRVLGVMHSHLCVQSYASPHIALIAPLLWFFEDNKLAPQPTKTTRRKRFWHTMTRSFWLLRSCESVIKVVVGHVLTFFDQFNVVAGWRKKYSNDSPVPSTRCFKQPGRWRPWPMTCQTNSPSVRVSLTLMDVLLQSLWQVARRRSSIVERVETRKLMVSLKRLNMDFGWSRAFASVRMYVGEVLCACGDIKKKLEE